MPAVYDHIHDVRDEEIDRHGHVNNLHYLSWMIDAAVAHSRANGWSSAEYSAIGSSWVVREHRIRYRRPAFSGDRITVRTWIAEFSRATCRRLYRMQNEDGDLLAESETEWAWVNTTNFRPGRIPAEVLDAFEVVVSIDDARPNANP